MIDRSRPRPKAVPAARQEGNLPTKTGGRIGELITERDVVKKSMQDKGSPERQKELMSRWMELSGQIIKERQNGS